MEAKIEGVNEWRGAEGVDVKKCVQHASLADTNGKTDRDNPLYKTSFDAREMAMLFECVWHRQSLVLMKYDANRRLPV